MKDQIINLAQALIQRPSISPDDQGCQQLIAEQLSEAGFKLEWMPFGDTLNLWATHGEGEPCLTFAGHTDVVPIGDENQWIYPPFQACIVNNQLYGRGAADMKGSLAAMVIAAIHFIKNNPKHQGKIALLITSDEEASATNGTVKVVEQLMQRHESIDYCIVGEPSSTKQLGDTVKNGRRGSITADLYITGIQGHVAYPHLAENPIHKVQPFLNELIAYPWDNGNSFFPPSGLQITNIKAGTGSNNVIPSECYIQFNLRYCTEINDETIKAVIAQLLEKYHLKYRIKWHLSGKPFLTTAGKLVDTVTNVITTITRIVPQLETSGGTSDGRFIAQMNAEVVEFGPLNATIHKVNECVDIDDLAKCGEIYYHIAKILL